MILLSLIIIWLLCHLITHYLSTCPISDEHIQRIHRHFGDLIGFNIRLPSFNLSITMLVALIMNIMKNHEPD